MAETNLYAIPDGETLRVLESRLEIVRREKHEWKPSLEKLTPERLARRTDKIHGSKFYPTWTLPVLVNWIERVVIDQKWSLRPGQSSEVDMPLDRKIGLVAGVSTSKIRVLCDGHYVHAYPIAE